MEKAKVYFSDFRTQVGTSMTEKLKRLCIAAGFKNIDMNGKFVAIKMHFGELGNPSRSCARITRRRWPISSRSRGACRS